MKHPKTTIKRAIGAGMSLALCLTGGLVPTIWATPAHAATGKPVLTMGLTNYTATLNPAISGGGDQSMPIDLAYASLTHINPDGSISPALATSWRYVGTGNTTFELTLRHDARFSDGTPVTASAVKTYFGYLLSAKGPSLSLLPPIESITTLGDWTVVFHLGAPSPEMPYLMSEASSAAFIISPKAIGDPKALGTQTDGAGPYVAAPSQSIPGSVYVFTPNQYFYDQSAIHFSKVVVKVISQTSTMLEAIRSGQLNVAAGDITTASAAEAAGLNVVTAPSGFVMINVLDRGPKTPDGSASNPLASVKVRQALNYAVNRKAVTAAIYGKYGAPTSEMGSSDGFAPNMQYHYPYDPAKAKALLAAAGYPHGFTFNITSESIFGTLADPVLEAVAQEYSAIGVTMKITTTATLPIWINQFYSGKYSADGFVATSFPPLSEWYTFFLAPKGLGNQHGWDDPVLDHLANEAATAPNAAPYWRAMTERTVVEADQIPVFNFDAFWFTAKEIGGLSFSADNGTPYPTEWYAK
jgi:peptide/nickel transport system substrate-binding protein